MIEPEIRWVQKGTSPKVAEFKVNESKSGRAQKLTSTNVDEHKCGRVQKRTRPKVYESKNGRFQKWTSLKVNKSKSGRVEKWTSRKRGRCQKRLSLKKLLSKSLLWTWVRSAIQKMDESKIGWVQNWISPKMDESKNFTKLTIKNKSKQQALLNKDDQQ